MPGAMGSFQTGVGNATGITGQVAGAGAPQMTAAQMAAAHMDAATAYGGIDHYMDPYLNDVVNTTLTGFDKNAGLQRAQAQMGLAGDTTFGGSGGSIYKALLEGNLSDSRAATEAGLRSQGYAQALAAAQQDAQRQQEANSTNAGFTQGANSANAGFQQQAGATNAGLADSNLTRQLAAGGQLGNLADMGLTGAIAGDANTRSNIDTQSAQGDLIRQIALQHNLAPITVASALSGLWGSTPFGLLHGENDTSHSTSTQTVSDPMGTIASLAGAAGSLATGLGGLGLKLPGAGAAASDRRLKRNIDKLGELPSGLGVYAYHYLWDEDESPRRLGVMAQEVLGVNPAAVLTMPNGFLAVDYGAL